MKRGNGLDFSKRERDGRIDSRAETSSKILDERVMWKRKLNGEIERNDKGYMCCFDDDVAEESQ